MTTRFRALVAPVAALALVVLLASAAAAQPADPSGHWEGAITAPLGEIPIALDLARRDGTVVATFSRQDGSVTGFPLSDVEVKGSEVKMTLKANGGGTMRASIASGQMTGSFAAFAGTVPFAVTRTGEARFAAPLISTAISKALEGTWTARLAAGPDSTTFRMTLANQPDGTAVGRMADDHGVEVPVKLTQDDARVTLEIPSAHGSFTGTLNTEGTEISGTYVEGPLTAPVTFNRVP
jgi:hypothetical protein